MGPAPAVSVLVLGIVVPSLAGYIEVGRGALSFPHRGRVLLILERLLGRSGFLSFRSGRVPP